jgi:hypothetical protein
MFAIGFVTNFEATTRGRFTSSLAGHARRQKSPFRTSDSSVQLLPTCQSALPGWSDLETRIGDYALTDSGQQMFAADSFKSRASGP